KMLYDNAQLVELLTLAHLRSGDALFARRVTETIEWLQTEMTTGGGLASAIDADSEGEEGRFYVWTAEEIDRLLGADAAFFRRAYGVTGKGNWEGKNILNRLHVRQAPDEVEESRLARCRARLLEARGRRTRPLTDDKVLTDWNGLAIHAIATAGMSLDRSDWIEFATQLFERILATHARDDTLVHSHRNGRALELAFLDDYAQMMRAALTLFEATGEERYLERLQAWNGEVQAHFADGEGGYYLHGPGTEELIVRGRNAHDGPTPSANGTLALVLERLGRLTGDPSATQQARTLVERFALDAARNPFAHATLLSAALALERPAQVVLIDAGGDERRAFVEAVRRTARPDVTLQIVSRGAALAEQHPAHGKSAIDGRCTAYVCIGPTCLAPVTDAAALEALLRAPIAATS
ncbi:MAG: thioredoxin domain-containing protein, partial [Geminicoccaceae bacterium]|nr:thioredoxin domain-containing protein [Geminicoccaceae bacterium]